MGRLTGRRHSAREISRPRTYNEGAICGNCAMFRLLNEDEVRQALAGQDVVALMEQALAAYSAGRAVQHVRSAMIVGAERAVFSFMPAHLPALNALGSKVYTVFNSNRARGLPTHFSMIMLFDTVTGELLALMDGRHVTEIRTAAVSMLAIKFLAACPVRRLALFGCGVQARGHLRALAAAPWTLEEVSIWSPFADRPAFVEEMRSTLGFALVESPSGEEAVRGADLVILATSSSTPVVQCEWIDPGALVISVGACRPDQREMDPQLLSESRLVVDSRAAALEESGDISQGIAEGRFAAGHIRAELGEVVLGRATARDTDTDKVVFKSLGMAVEDVIVAETVYRRAVRGNIGSLIGL